MPRRERHRAAVVEMEVAQQPARGRRACAPMWGLALEAVILSRRMHSEHPPLVSG